MKTSIKTSGFFPILAFLLTAAGAPVPRPESVLDLARDGETAYAVVVAADASGVDRYAAAELALYLKQITGAVFPIREESDLAADTPALFVGLGGVAAARLGEANPTAGFPDQTHVWRTHARDIFLHGAGVHGNLYAVMGLLEDQLGWRWYTLFEPPVLPKTPTLTLSPFERRRDAAFLYLGMDLQRSLDFPYQMGVTLNMGPAVRRAMRRVPSYPRRSERAFVSALPTGAFVGSPCHTLFGFIPPLPDHPRWPKFFDLALGPAWQETETHKNYFETHPDYFSMGPGGQRVPNRQLCLSNPALRAELTRKILRVIEIERDIEGIDDLVVPVAAMDNTDAFCHCPDCKALEEKYRTPGGPLFDYLLDLCDRLRKEHPSVRVATLAYRRSQTQIPPTLPEGQRLPDNLIVWFAPVEDNLFADWTHPDASLQETFRHLRQWAALLREGNLLGWYYGPWGAASYLPVGDTERFVETLRLMHSAGVRGIIMDTPHIHNRGLFGELQRYLLFKLRWDIHADADAIVREFTDALYGPAAGMLREYMGELEAERKTMIANELPPGVHFAAPREARNFPYLTPGNIHRWQGYFERMTVLVQDASAACRTNVQLARRQLDLATLWKWFDLQAAYPETYRDHQTVVDRIEAADDTRPQPTPTWEKRREERPDGLAWNNRNWHRHPLGGVVVKDLVTVIRGGGQAKPLPPELADVAPDRVRRFVPENRFSIPLPGHSPVGERTVTDPDAAFGYAATTYLPEQQPGQKLPFTFGVRPKQKQPSVTRSVKRDEIQPGIYRLYRIGPVVLTPESSLWMPEWSCSTLLEIGQRLYEPGADNQWAIYVSLKFDGPTYGGNAAEDRVWCDQVIAVRTALGQFEPSGPR